MKDKRATELRVICDIGGECSKPLPTHMVVSSRFFRCSHECSKRWYYNGESWKLENPNIEVHEHWDSTDSFSRTVSQFGFRSAWFLASAAARSQLRVSVSIVSSNTFRNEMSILCTDVSIKQNEILWRIPDNRLYTIRTNLVVQRNMTFKLHLVALSSPSNVPVHGLRRKTLGRPCYEQKKH